MSSRDFEFCTIVHLVEPTGVVACDLRELEEGIRAADLRTLFHHTHERLLRDPTTDEPTPTDFARWSEHFLLDPEAAERLEFATLWRGRGIESMRESLLKTLDELNRDGHGARRLPDNLGFRFQRAHTLAMSSGMVAHEPEEAIDYVAALDAREFFYHFYEAEALSPGSTDDLPAWLRESGAPRLANAADDVLTSGMSLYAARQALLRRWRRSGIAGRLAGKAALPEATRQGEAREVVAHLVRGWRDLDRGEQP